MLIPSCVICVHAKDCTVLHCMDSSVTKTILEVDLHVMEYVSTSVPVKARENTCSCSTIRTVGCSTTGSPIQVKETGRERDGDIPQL